MPLFTVLHDFGTDLNLSVPTTPEDTTCSDAHRVVTNSNGIFTGVLNVTGGYAAGVSKFTLAWRPYHEMSGRWLPVYMDAIGVDVNDTGCPPENVGMLPDFRTVTNVDQNVLISSKRYYVYFVQPNFPVAIPQLVDSEAQQQGYEVMAIHTWSDGLVNAQPVTVTLRVFCGRLA